MNLDFSLVGVVVVQKKPSASWSERDKSNVGRQFNLKEAEYDSYYYYEFEKRDKKNESLREFSGRASVALI